jgi:cyclase
LRTIVLVVALVLAAAEASAEEFFDLVEIAQGVYGALVVDRPPTYVFANALVVIDEAGVVVVDTHQSPSAATALVGKIEALTEAPVRYVINTHWHGDHVYGNQVYRDRYPGAVFIGHQSTREDMLGEGVARRAEELEALPESIHQRELWLETGKGPEGRPLTEALRERLEYSRSARTRYLAELGAVDLVPPNLTFERKLVLYLGRRTVEVRHLGRAHTRGDVVVYLPDVKILAVGDLLEDGFPYFGDAYPSGWAKALQEVGSLEAAVLFPSHGPILRDRELLDVETRLLSTLTEDVRQAVADGLSIEEAKDRVVLEEFRSFFGGDDPARAEDYRENVRAAVERAYREASGQLE